MSNNEPKYSKEFINKAKKFIKEKYGDKYINSKINLLTNKNKNVIIYPDTLEKRNRRLEETTTDPIYEKIERDGQERRD